MLKNPDAETYTVSRLNRSVKILLSECLGSVWVEGELSNLSTPTSGHVYFTLKDREAQVRCALFKSQARYLTLQLENGQKIRVRAQITLYESRGDYQLVVERIETAGAGALQQTFLALQAKLAAEGLFDTAHKRALPVFPQQIGVITSPTGAALRDILTVLKRRYPVANVTLFPSRVQGADAPNDLVRAVQRADQTGCCVLIVARGGGSLEDLWAFNDERVVRALYACQTPVVSAVGHETDVTLADWVADQRAPTPSAAAETVTPEAAVWRLRVQRLHQQLMMRWRQRWQAQQQCVLFLDKRLQQQHPRQRLRERMQRLDELDARLRRAWQQRVAESTQRCRYTQTRLLQQNPFTQNTALTSHCMHLQRRLQYAWQRQFEHHQQRLTASMQALHTVSPLATLGRGYSLTQRVEDAALLRDSRSVQPGELILTRLAQGQLLSRVETLSVDDL